MFYNIIVSEKTPLQVMELCTLFDVAFSVQGSNKRARENTTICFWHDWLIDIEVLITWTFICGHFVGLVVKSGCINMVSSLKLVHIVL